MVSARSYNRDPGSMEARSRSLFGARVLARATAALPCVNAAAGRIPAANGLPHALSATPHSAIVHDGSASSAALNPSTARPNSNECSNATPRLKAGCAVAVQEVANSTRPSSPPTVAACSCSCPAAAAETPSATAQAMALMVLMRQLIPYDAG